VHTPIPGSENHHWMQNSMVIHLKLMLIFTATLGSVPLGVYVAFLYILCWCGELWE
jgi:hypothetical protein